MTTPKTDLPDHEFLKPQEVALYLRVSRATIYRLIDEGRLYAIKLMGNKTNGSLRVLRASVKRIAETRWED